MKSKLRQAIAMVLAALFVLPSLGGCAKKAAESAKDTLTIANVTDCTNFDPQGGLSIGSSVVKCQIYENLVRVDANGEIQPELAQSWEYQDDTTIVFHLRRDVKFSNGAPMTADDVLFSLQRACASPASSSITAALDASSLEKTDDYTIRVALLYPFEPVLKHLAQMTVGIMCKAVVEGNGGAIDAGNVVGTGPYVLDEWVQGSSVTLKKNEAYWGEAPKVAKLVFRTITESNSRVLELQSGNIDIMLSCTDSEIQTLKTTPDIKIDSIASYYNEYISFNNEQERFQDENVRKAICYAIDKEAIASAVLGETGSALYGPLASGVWGYTDDVTKYTFDLDKAKACMAASAFPNGFSCRLVTDATSNRLDAAEIIKNQLAQIGIMVDIQVVEQAEYSQALHFLGFDMIMGLWVAVCGDPDYGMYPCYYSTCIDGQGNYGHVNDPRIDELLDLGRTTMDKESRRECYVELQQYMTEIAANCPLWETNNVVALGKNVRGFVNDPNEFYHFCTCSFE